MKAESSETKQRHCLNWDDLATPVEFWFPVRVCCMCSFDVASLGPGGVSRVLITLEFHCHNHLFKTDKIKKKVGRCVVATRWPALRRNGSGQWRDSNNIRATLH